MLGHTINPKHTQPANVVFLPLLVKGLLNITLEKHTHTLAQIKGTLSLLCEMFGIRSKCVSVLINQPFQLLSVFSLKGLQVLGCSTEQQC